MFYKEISLVGLIPAFEMEIINWNSLSQPLGRVPVPGLVKYYKLWVKQIYEEI